MAETIPEPFVFNPMKHHAGSIRDFIFRCRVGGVDSELLKNTLLKMGNCMLDLYFGDLEIGTILGEIEGQLRNWHYFERKAYLQYIRQSGKNYQKIQLSDGSNWTLLAGQDPGRYLHLHPSRGSKHSIRVRAIALKTALVMKACYPHQRGNVSLVELTNEIRSRFLGESPIKNMRYTRGIRRALAHL